MDAIVSQQKFTQSGGRDSRRRTEAGNADRIGRSYSLRIKIPASGVIFRVFPKSICVVQKVLMRAFDQTEGYCKTAVITGLFDN
jgi:hypothetical protein